MKLTKSQQMDLMDVVEATLGRRKPNLTVSEFAQITGMHKDTVRGMCMSGEMPSYQRMKGSPYMIFFHELSDFINVGRRAA